MNVAIVGFATEGRISYQYFASRGHRITICDQNPAITLPSGVAAQLGDDYLENLHVFDLVVRSAGIPPQQIIARNPGIGPKVTTAVNEFLAACPTPNTIGVTGTKGKGTTSTLITKMLQAAGKRVFLGGNIGNSPLEFIDQITPDDWVVLELSSFQLSDIRHSPHIGVCLMVVPEHLNWHVNMADYIAAKSNMFQHQTARDTAIYYANNNQSKSIAGTSPGIKIPYFSRPGACVAEGAIQIENQEICKITDIKLLGEHNWQNICAAVTAVWQVTQDATAISHAIKDFEGLPHRLELVRSVNGISYYNDSFSSGLHATEAALQAIPGPKLLIVGGYDRMLPLEHFPIFLAAHPELQLDTMLLIGACQQRLAETLSRAGITNYVCSNAQDIAGVIKDANNLAHPGQSIVFSPGFASFDMFKNFEDRGDLYKQAVQSL